MNIKSSATQSCLVLKINTYNTLARTFFRISQTLHPTTCGRCPENGQRRLLIVQCGSTDGVLVLDGTAQSETAGLYSAPVTGSRAIGRRSPRITWHLCGSESTVAICSSAEPHVTQVLGSASGYWGGGAGMDLLDMEGMVSFLSSNIAKCLRPTFADGECGRMELSERPRGRLDSTRSFATIISGTLRRHEYAPQYLIVALFLLSARTVQLRTEVDDLLSSLYRTTIITLHFLSIILIIYGVGEA
jgi:hypothetical protein